MEFGVLMFPADYAVAPDALARMAEEAKFVEEYRRSE